MIPFCFLRREAQGFPLVVDRLRQGATRRNPAEPEAAVVLHKGYQFRFPLFMVTSPLPVATWWQFRQLPL